MSHSLEQKRKKEEALRESHEHQNSNVMNPRGGKEHEDHKMAQMMNDEAEGK